MKPKILITVLAFLAFTASASEPVVPHTFAIGTNDFLLDGRRFQIRCGEIHASRVPKEYWRHRLQMARAMGLNTVCAYLFWNVHEPRPGQFVWSGQADAAEFCRIAQQEGLWVILRPGPYSCAEWEMGGFPWWLLKTKDIRLRTRDPRYLSAAKRYLEEVGRALGPLQVTKGGPILMVQVENEYGFYGSDVQYMGDIRQATLDAGFNVPLFVCNPLSVLTNGYRADLFPVINFGSDPAGGFRALRGILPEGPLMCGEFYPGWFDTWGVPHHTGNMKNYLADLEYMLKTGASFSIYMVHGGTSFGFSAGADRPFRPDTSSYDYDAPISEAGWTTEKYFKTRELFSRYLLPGETIPEPPPNNPVISIKPVEAMEFAPIFSNLPKAVSDEAPRTMEEYDQGFGCILYRTTIPAGPAQTLALTAVHDIAQVFLNGTRLGFLDRRRQNFRIRLPERKAPATLDLLVEAMGRVNFGVEVHDWKGVLGPVTIEGKALTGWEVFNLPLDAKMLAGLKFSSATPKGPAFYRTTVSIEKPGDCFLDMRPWNKGFAWINGHNLGRFWNIGPQQTLYIPGPWLKAGKNEIVVLDLVGPEKPVIAALDKPILDQLRPEADFAYVKRPAVKPNLNSTNLVQVGTFAPGSATQEFRLTQPAHGRFFCIESLNALDGRPYAAIAELSLLDANGHPLNTEGWTIAYVDSEERAREDGSAENAIDGQTSDFWHSQWGDASPDHPHRLILNLGQSQVIGGFRYVPRQGNESGRIKDFRIYVGDDLVQ